MPPTETTTLLAQNGGTASGFQDPWARSRGPPDAVSPVLAGPAGINQVNVKDDEGIQRMPT
eukprot:6583921-Pyramimonas_sp.AAC.1